MTQNNIPFVFPELKTYSYCLYFKSHFFYLQSVDIKTPPCSPFAFCNMTISTLLFLKQSRAKNPSRSNYVIVNFFWEKLLSFIYLRKNFTKNKKNDRYTLQILKLNPSKRYNRTIH